MLKQIIAFSVRNKLIVGILIIALIGWGIFQVSRLPIDAVPDITDNQVQVITTSPALGAPDVERLITFPIEQVNSNIPGLKQIRSFSRFGLSVVTLVFNDNVDVYWARQLVSERLQQVQSQIPQEFGQPQMAPVTTGLGEIYQYVIRPKHGYEGKYDLTQLRTIQDWIVRRQLLGTPGIADVASFGGKLKQYEIAIDPYKLQSYRITIDDVFNALKNNNQNTGGAYIERGPTVLFIRSEGLVTDRSDISKIVIKSVGGETPLLIGDVADIRIGYATRYGAMTFNDQGEVAGAVVMMLKGENSSAVIKKVKAKIAQIEKTLPEGVMIDPFLDRTKMVDHAISTVKRNLIEGALIVVFVLVLFLGNLRAGLIVASVIPLSMLFAVILMNLFGVSGNLMSLGAIDFGLIVDGAVIIVEAVMHKLNIFKKDNRLIDQSGMDQEVRTSASRMMNAAVFGQAIILIVYLPIFSLQGIEGKMFRPMAQTVSFALIGAFLLSLTYVPMMTSLFISKKSSPTPSISERIMDKLEKNYERILGNMLRHSRIFIAGAVLLFFIAAFVLTRLGGEFIPKLEEGDFATDTRLLTGSSLTASVNTLLKAAHILKTRFPEVEKVVGKNGSSEIPTDPMSMEASDLMIILKDKNTWTSAKTFDELAQKMQDSLQQIPGVTFGFQYPVQMRFNELISGARQDVVCKIFGENLDSLALYANRLGAIIKAVDGATDLYVETISGMPQIVVKYDRAAIARFGLNINSINRSINTAFAGQQAGLVFEGEKRFDLVVRLANDQRQRLQDVQNLLISSASGNFIPLNQLADIKITEGPSQIQREDAKRRIMIGFNVRGRDVQSVVGELQQKINARIHFPPGYYVNYGGSFENLQAAQKRLSVAVPVSLMLIFLMLYFAFNSVRQSILIYTAIPLSAIGGIAALALRGLPFSISAGIGFIALFGVAVLNGIVLITEFNRLAEEGATDLRYIVMKGASVRLRPVLMTATVASLGFLPMALSTGAGAEVQRPLATVVIGGLLTATFLTLFLLPMLYILFGRKKKSPKTSKMLTILLLCVIGSYFETTAQTSISLSAATDTALHNNRAIQIALLNVDYSNIIQKTAAEIPKTNVILDLGQINSIYTDSKLSVLQTINFPSVYARQKAVYTAQTEKSRTVLRGTQIQIQAAVKQLYGDIILRKQKRHLLQFADSIYASFLQKSELRFAAGETGIAQKAAAENQRQQILLQLEAVEADLASAIIQFNIVLAGHQQLIPADSTLTAGHFEPDTTFESNIPALQLKEKDIGIAQKTILLQKSKLLPDLLLGYSNQSIIGSQIISGTEKYFSPGKRFNSVQAGMSVSLFNSSQKNKVRAAEKMLQQMQMEYDQQQQTLLSSYQTLSEQYRVQKKAVGVYETILLRNAEDILRTANQQFENGEVNYLEWVLLTNQAIAVRSAHLDALTTLLNIQIQLQLLTGQFK